MRFHVADSHSPSLFFLPPSSFLSYLSVRRTKINQDYRKELEATQNRLDAANLDFQTRAGDYARLLDLRATKINQLETRLKDIAYGTTRHSIPPTTDDDGVGGVLDVDGGGVVDLRRGQNIFEIRVFRASLSEAALSLLSDPRPSIFVTFEFFEHPIQSTAVLKGPEATFDEAARFVVVVDDFFLHFLQRETTLFELHQAFGADYRTLAAARVSFAEALGADGRLQAASALLGVGDHFRGAAFGTLEFSVRLTVPMPQSLKLYRERAKALDYVGGAEAVAAATAAASSSMSNTGVASTTTTTTPIAATVTDLNQLEICVISASDVGADRAAPPGVYAIYRFRDQPPHYTRVREGGRRRVDFDDAASFPVRMDATLHRFLKSEALKISLFDDAAASDFDSFLGFCQVRGKCRILTTFSFVYFVRSGVFSLLKSFNYH